MAAAPLQGQRAVVRHGELLAGDDDAGHPGLADRHVGGDALQTLEGTARDQQQGRAARALHAARAGRAHDSTHIGEVESVSCNQVTVRMASTYPSNMSIVGGVVYRIGQNGSFPKIPPGYANLYGLITRAGVQAMLEALLERYREDPSVGGGRRWLPLILVVNRSALRSSAGCYSPEPAMIMSTW